MKTVPETVWETAVNLVSEDTTIEGKVIFGEISRVHGVLKGEVFARNGSTLILGETGVIDGDINADTLVVDGYVCGDITAKTKVVISRTGRVIGNIKTASLILEFGSYFEGKCLMDGATPSPNLIKLTTSNPSPKPA